MPYTNPESPHKVDYLQKAQRRTWQPGTVRDIQQAVLPQRPDRIIRELAVPKGT
jgi:hypothetical protein